MEKRYMLIEVVERDIDGVMYNTFDEAREAMVESYEETAKKGCLDCEMSMW